MPDNDNAHATLASWDPNTHYKDEGVAAQYDAIRFSSPAGRVFNRLERATIVNAFAGVPLGATIADFPCGTGRLAEALLEAGYRVHGLDISAEMLQVASRRLSRFGSAFTTEVLDAKNVGHDHATYDGLLCARVLMHFPLDEQIKFLQGASRLTNGPIVINHSLNSAYQRMRRGVKRLLRHQTPARHPIRRDEIETLVKSCGLRVQERYRLNSMVSEAIYIVACSAAQPAPTSPR